MRIGSGSIVNLSGVEIGAQGRNMGAELGGGCCGVVNSYNSFEYSLFI